MLIGKAEDFRQRVIALGVRLDSYNHVRQRPVGPISEGVLIVDFVDRVCRNQLRADDLSKLDNDLIDSEHLLVH
jgi:hypothetical protein